MNKWLKQFQEIGQAAILENREVHASPQFNVDFQFLGGLSLHLNHLIQSRMEIS